ncbi:YvcK family protein [Patescibacteria group bacterium]|nr:YvcK family protein [Patescibacteria group bacterium]MBU1473235.1 YvcK family protein [Patescibacteria group bacterium]MBU2459491.1 YvcK family protein [Patescibacteria group bacterium]MBU2544150.1 YvcK family protein [Patescibacteria group bacterium]
MKKRTGNTRIVCIGGGTGTFVTLRGLKKYPCQLSAIVTMSDSGGSNKRIRDEFGLLPTSDIRQCFIALSDENGGVGILRRLFMYRFEKGTGISGMTFGNLFMAALSDIAGSQKEAIQQTGKVLRIHGKVIPVSFTNTNLAATYDDGHVVGEEHLIDEPPHDGRMHITDIYLKPKAEANPDALAAIEKAVLIVLGPGDLYTSVIPNFLVSGIPGALRRSKAVVVYVLNLMTKYGQTYGFTAQDHIRVLTKYINRYPDVVLINNAPLPHHALTLYAKNHEYPVVDDIPTHATYNVIRANLVSQHVYSKASSDALVRSLIRHDSEKIAKTLISIEQRRK